MAAPRADLLLEELELRLVLLLFSEQTEYEIVFSNTYQREVGEGKVYTSISFFSLSLWSLYIHISPTSLFHQYTYVAMRYKPGMSVHSITERSQIQIVQDSIIGSALWLGMDGITLIPVSQSDITQPHDNLSLHFFFLCL